MPFPAISGAEPCIGSISSLGIDIRPGCESHSSGNRRPNVGKYIAEQVRRDDDAEAGRISDHKHSGRVDEQHIGLDVGIVATDFGKRLVPEHHRVVESVAFRDARQLFAGRAREFVGVPHYAFASAACEDPVLDHRLVRKPRVFPFALSRVLALGVFSHEYHIDIAGLLSLQRAGSSGEQFYGPQVDVLIESLADLKQQSAERNMVGYRRVADGAEKNRVVPGQNTEPVRGHHPAGPVIIAAAPGVFVKIKPESAGASRGFQRSDRLRRHLWTDTVPGDDRYAVFFYFVAHFLYPLTT